MYYIHVCVCVGLFGFGGCTLCLTFQREGVSKRWNQCFCLHCWGWSKFQPGENIPLIWFHSLTHSSFVRSFVRSFINIYKYILSVCIIICMWMYVLYINAAMMIIVIICVWGCNPFFFFLFLFYSVETNAKPLTIIIKFIRVYLFEIIFQLKF